MPQIGHTQSGPQFCARSVEHIFLLLHFAQRLHSTFCTGVQLLSLDVAHNLQSTFCWASILHKICIWPILLADVCLHPKQRPMSDTPNQQRCGPTEKDVKQKAAQATKTQTQHTTAKDAWPGQNDWSSMMWSRETSRARPQI